MGLKLFQYPHKGVNTTYIIHLVRQKKQAEAIFWFSRIQDGYENRNLTALARNTIDYKCPFLLRIIINQLCKRKYPIRFMSIYEREMVYEYPRKCPFIFDITPIEKPITNYDHHLLLPRCPQFLTQNYILKNLEHRRGSIISVRTIREYLPIMDPSKLMDCLIRRVFPINYFLKLFREMIACGFNPLTQKVLIDEHISYSIKDIISMCGNDREGFFNTQLHQQYSNKNTLTDFLIVNKIREILKIEQELFRGL